MDDVQLPLFKRDFMSILVPASLLKFLQAALVSDKYLKRERDFLLTLMYTYFSELHGPYQIIF